MSDDFFELVLADLHRKGGTTPSALPTRLDEWRTALLKMRADAEMVVGAMDLSEERARKLRFLGTVCRRLSEVNAMVKARNVVESSKGHESVAERLDRIEAKLDRLLTMALDARQP